MVRPRDYRFNLGVEKESQDVAAGTKIRSGSDVGQVGEVATDHRSGRDLWASFDRLWTHSRRARGKPAHSHSRPALEAETAAGVLVHRERPLSRAAAPGDARVRLETGRRHVHALPGMQHRITI